MKKYFQPRTPIVYGYSCVSAELSAEDHASQKAADKAYFCQHFESLGHIWRGHFVDQPGCEKVRFLERPEAMRANRLMKPKDILVVHRYEDAFLKQHDFVSTASLFQKRGLHLVIADINIDTTRFGWNACYAVAAVANCERNRRISRRDRLRAKGKLPPKKPPRVRKPRVRPLPVVPPYERSLMVTIERMVSAKIPCQVIAYELNITGLGRTDYRVWTAGNVWRELMTYRIMLKAERESLKDKLDWQI